MSKGPKQDNKLPEKWRALVKALEEECFRNSQHPGGGVLLADEAQLKVSLPTSSGTRISKTFTRSQVLNDDPHRLAYDFYESYKKSK